MTDAAGRWHRDWATEALARDEVPGAAADNAAFQRAGKALFDVYRTEHARLRTLVDDRAAQTRAAQRRLFLAGMTAQCVTWLALVLAAVRRRKRSHQVLVAPIAELAATVD